MSLSDLSPSTAVASHLIRTGETTIAGAVEATGASQATAYRVLEGLEQAGAVSRVSESPTKYVLDVSGDPEPPAPELVSGWQLIPRGSNTFEYHRTPFLGSLTSGDMINFTVDESGTVRVTDGPRHFNHFYEDIGAFVEAFCDGISHGDVEEGVWTDTYHKISPEKHVGESFVRGPIEHVNGIDDYRTVVEYDYASTAVWSLKLRVVCLDQDPYRYRIFLGYEDRPGTLSDVSHYPDDDMLYGEDVMPAIESLVGIIEPWIQQREMDLIEIGVSADNSPTDIGSMQRYDFQGMEDDLRIEYVGGFEFESRGSGYTDVIDSDVYDTSSEDIEPVNGWRIDGSTLDRYPRCSREAISEGLVEFVSSQEDRRIIIRYDCRSGTFTLTHEGLSTLNEDGVPITTQFDDFSEAIESAREWMGMECGIDPRENLTSLPNIGPKTAGKLADIGVETDRDLYEALHSTQREDIEDVYRGDLEELEDAIDPVQEELI